MDDRLRDAPLGTKAPAIMGGAWLKTERGWQWNGGTRCPGSTFPRPGGDWNGELIYPVPSEPYPAAKACRYPECDCHSPQGPGECRTAGVGASEQAKALRDPPEVIAAEYDRMVVRSAMRQAVNAIESIMAGTDKTCTDRQTARSAIEALRTAEKHVRGVPGGFEMNDYELNRRELTGDDALRFAREAGMLRMVGSPCFTAGVGDLIRFARLCRAGWTPPASGVEGLDEKTAAPSDADARKDEP